MISSSRLLGILACAAPLVAQATESAATRPNASLLPRAIASFGAASLDGWVYAYGGHVGKAHAHSRDNLSGSFWRWRGSDVAHAETLPSSRPLQSVALVAHEGALYRLGGMTARNAKGAKADLESTADVARFDPAQGSWQSLAPLPAPRSSHDALVLGGKLYVAGGWQLGASGSKWLDFMHVGVFDEGTVRWTKAAVPFRRRALVLGQRGGLLFAIGGLTAKGKMSQAVDVYDPQTQSWSKGPEIPFRGFGAACANVGGELLVSGMGGRVVRLNDAGDQWMPCGSMHISRFFHRMVSLDQHRCLAIAGAGPGDHSRTVEVLDRRRNRDVGASWVLPIKNVARLQGSVLNGGELLLFADLENGDPGAYAINLGRMEVRTLGTPASSLRRAAVVRTVRGKRRPNPSIFVAGGAPVDGAGSQSQGAVWRLRPKTGVWSKAAFVLPRPRVDFALVGSGPEAWVVGGAYLGEAQLPREILTMDPVGDQVVNASLTLPKGRREFGVAQFEDELFLVGGLLQNGQCAGDVDAVHVRTGATRTLPAPLSARLNPQLVAISGGLLVAGGRSPEAAGESQPVTTIERLVPHRGTWELVAKSLPLNAEGLQMHAFGHRVLFAGLDDRNHVTVKIMPHGFGARAEGSSGQ